MIRHVVVYSFVPELPPDRRAAIVAALEGLVGVIPGLLSMQAGADLGLADGNGHFALVADLADAEAWRGYQEHPAHQQVADTMIRPFVAGRTAVQFVLADPPATA